MIRSGLVCLFAVLALAAKPAPPVSNVLSPNAGDWTTISLDTRGYAVDGRIALQAGPSFTFPSVPLAVNYLYSTKVPSTISGSLSITLSVYAAVAPVVFDFKTEAGNTCDQPLSNVRLFFWSHWGRGPGHGGDPRSYAEFDRWWANPDAIDLASALTSGVLTMTVPLTPDRWSSVYGRFGNADVDALAGFSTARTGVSALGVTAGGGCWYGHGVRTSSGSARFELLRYEVMP